MHAEHMWEGRGRGHGRSERLCPTWLFRSEQAPALEGSQLPAFQKIMCRVCIDGHTPPKPYRPRVPCKRKTPFWDSHCRPVLYGPTGIPVTCRTLRWTTRVAGLAHGLVVVADDSSDRFGPALYARSRNSGRRTAIGSRDVVRPPNATGVPTVDAAQSHLPADICALTSLASSPPTRPQRRRTICRRQARRCRSGRTSSSSSWWVLYP